MPRNRPSPAVEVAVLSGEHRIRTALQALLETDGYTVTVGATAGEAHGLLASASSAAVVIGLGAGAAGDAAMLGVARAACTDRMVVVGSRDGIDLDAGPDAILAAVAEAVARCAGTDAR